MTYLGNAIENLKGIGVFDILLPFMLIFVVIYAILTKSKILGENRKNFNVALAFVISMITIVYTPLIALLNEAIPHVSVVIVAVIMALILIGVFGGQVSWIGGSLSGIIALISFGIIIYIFGNAAGWWNRPLPPMFAWLNDPQTQATLVVLLVFGLIIWFVTREEKKDDSAGSKLLNGFGDMFKKQ
jgi:hypothetical protein